RVEPGDEFAPTALLAMGNLPGSPAVARDVPARGGGWNPLARLDMTTRQAIQVALAGSLAILIGRQVSATRYYWAVIAAFVAFTGTATRSETFVKATNRVVGTLTGLVAAIGLANLTAGHVRWVLAVILASMFCGFYLLRVSYAYMIFFVTIMVGQLYSVLHVFSAELLVLRLEETAIGAGVGITVALLVTPLSTRDTVRAARSTLLTALGDLLTAAATCLESGGAGPDLDALSRALDNRARELALVAKPLALPLPMGGGSPRVRHRLGLYAMTAAHARALAVGIRRHGPEPAPGAAAACRALAEAAGQLAEAVPGRPARSVSGSLAAADTAVFSGRPGGSGPRATDPVLRPLVDLHGVLTDLAATGAQMVEPPPRPAAAA
ncbi:MAG TPA: FUSC family protein, partial [Mycobacteriales bacterium]|nr:FUSC family protein [Mycobacteriales bacterium]